MFIVDGDAVWAADRNANNRKQKNMVFCMDKMDFYSSPFGFGLNAVNSKTVF
jgi:hypothetical protein